jgi:putative ABC transport system ATP-binding protein
MSAPLIQLDRVSKAYGEGDNQRAVLRETSAEIARGEFVAIRGRSGSGKSTLLNLVAGIDLPSSGDVLVEGVAVNRLTASARTRFRRDHLGFVFQFFNLIPTLSVLENVVLPAELAGTGSAAASRRGMELLEAVGLQSRAREFPDRLSGGEQQRVAIARALVRDPPLVLADEPTGALDDQTGESVLDLLDAMTRRAGRTLLLVTHSERVAARADRVLGIEAGHVVALPRA